MCFLLLLAALSHVAPTTAAMEDIAGTKISGAYETSTSSGDSGELLSWLVLPACPVACVPGHVQGSVNTGRSYTTSPVVINMFPTSGSVVSKGTSISDVSGFSLRLIDTPQQVQAFKSIASGWLCHSSVFASGDSAMHAVTDDAGAEETAWAGLVVSSGPSALVNMLLRLRTEPLKGSDLGITLMDANAPSVSRRVSGLRARWELPRPRVWRR